MTELFLKLHRVLWACSYLIGQWKGFAPSDVAWRGVEYSAFSTDGVLLFGSRESIRKAIDWHHAATGTVPSLRNMLIDAQAIQQQIHSSLLTPGSLKGHTLTLRWPLRPSVSA